MALIFNQCTKIKDDCKTELEIKKEALDEIEGLEIMDNIEPPEGSFYSET